MNYTKPLATTIDRLRAELDKPVVPEPPARDFTCCDGNCNQGRDCPNRRDTRPAVLGVIGVVLVALWAAAIWLVLP